MSLPVKVTAGRDTVTKSQIQHIYLSFQYRRKAAVMDAKERHDKHLF